MNETRNTCFHCKKEIKDKANYIEIMEWHTYNGMYGASVYTAKNSSKYLRFHTDCFRSIAGKEYSDLLEHKKP